MHYEVALPSLGEDAEDNVDAATVSSWLVEEGDQVAEGDDLIEMTTDKAAFNLPSPKSGALTQKLVEEGDEVKVGDAVCVLEIAESDQE